MSTTYDWSDKPLPLSDDCTVLNEPLTIGTVHIPNRLAIQPMEGADGTTDGTPDELTLRRYDRFAKSGAGLIWFEAVAVSHDGRANPRQLFLHDKNADAYKRLVSDIREKAIKENGDNPVIIMQATHSGRYARPESAPAPMIACNNPIYEADKPLPTERIVSDDTLQRIEADYATTTRLAMACGFDGIDVKACHRYLNNELLSAITRPGPYGGSLENRTRFYRNCVANARSVAGNTFCVTSRMNIYDGIRYPYGFGVNEGDGLTPDLTEPIAVIQSMGFDLINITMGNPYFNPQVNRPTDEAAVRRMFELTRQVRTACPGMAVVASAPTFMQEQCPSLAAGAITQGYADLVGFGRLAFAYPYFARDIRQGAFDKKQACIACGKCTELMRGSRAGCVVRDKLYTELYKEMQAKGKRV